MLSATSRDENASVFGQRPDTTTNTQQSAAAPRYRSPAANSLVHYRPRNPSESRHTPAFPTPHIRARQRRPHTIHIVSYPAGYVPTELRAILPPNHTDPSNTPKKSKSKPKPSRKRTSKDKPPGQYAAKRKRQNSQPTQETPPTGQTISSSGPVAATDSTSAAVPSARVRVFDKLRSVLFSPPTSLLSKAAEQHAPLAIDQVFSTQRHITVTTTPARPNSFLSFSRRLSATPSVAHDTTQSVLESEPLCLSPAQLPLAESAPRSPDMARHAQPPSDRTHSVGYPFSEATRTFRRNSTMSRGAVKNTATPKLPTSIAKPIAAAGGMSLDIVFAEPHVFLRGFEHNRLRDRERSSGYDVAPPILRGKMRLVVAKDVKIRGITIRLQNQAYTFWPHQCIDSLKAEYEETDVLRSQNQTVFNAIHGQWDGPYGNMCTYELKHAPEDSFTTMISRLTQGPHLLSDNSSISSGMTSREIKGFALDKVLARSFEKGDSPMVHPTQAKGYKVFHAGTYEYNFEFPIDHHQVETINLPHASVKWHVEAIIERAGAFKPNLHGKKEVSIVRIPDLLSLETVDPIALARPWEDQMFYEVCISGKSFPIGGKIPIAFKITPLAKVQIHKFKVYMTETIEYRASHKEYTRKETANKALLFEKAAGQVIDERYRHCEFRFVSGGESNGVSELRQDSERASNLLGNLESGNDAFWTTTEVEMNVNVPTCRQMQEDPKFRLHPDSSWRNAHVTHWIKVQMRVSRLDPEDPEGKRRRHFEISIDSPLTILSCAANHGNMSLPRYTGRDMGNSEDLRGFRCGCEDSCDTSLVRQSVPPIPTEPPPPSFSENPTSPPPERTTPTSSPPERATPTTSPSSSEDSIIYTPTTSDEGEEQERGESSNAPRPAPADEERARTDQVPSKPARPIHLMRAPSFAPPAFDDDSPPPVPADVASPPPQYDAIIGSPSVDGLADYFSRLADYDDTNTDSAAVDESDSDSENLPTRIASRTGRVNVSNPRTPGGVRHGPSRSMDIQRPAATFNLHLPTPVRRAIRE